MLDPNRLLRQILGSLVGRPLACVADELDEIGLRHVVAQALGKRANSFSLALVCRIAIRLEHPEGGRFDEREGSDSLRVIQGIVERDVRSIGPPLPSSCVE